MTLIHDAVLRSASYKKAKQDLIDSLRNSLTKISEPVSPDPELVKNYEELIKDMESTRGRELFYKMIPSGAGYGPFVELCDGSVKYDLITGIGVHFFGHGNLEILEAQFDGMFGETMQGNLGPNRDHLALSKALLQSVPKSKLKNVWITTCGATANEIALKLLRQKKSPASKIFAFKDCFAGRTTALQEITDNPKYREGQPTYGEVHHLPFYNPYSNNSPSEQANAVLKELKEEMNKKPNQYCGLEFEIVQGEGGFHFAPQEFILPIVREAKKLNLGIWADEIQTFGRTGEFFCFQRVGIDEYIDIVTVAKILQAAAVIYTNEYNPKAGLISGTFSASSTAIRSGLKIMEILKNRMVGPNGRVLELEKMTVDLFENMKKSEAGKHIQNYTVVGGMVAFTVYDGSLEKLKKLLFKLWDKGVIAFYCGHGPYRARMLPPFGALTNEQWKNIFKIIEETIIEAAT